MNNNLHSPLQVLKAKYKSAWSGCIEIEEPQDPSICWSVYLLEGKIQYITTTSGQQERLIYLWQRLKLGLDYPRIDSQKISEYAQVCQALNAGQHADDSKALKYLFRFCREGLTNILGIEKTQINLVPGRRIKSSIIGFSLDKLLVKLEEPVKINRYIRNFIYSPFSRLYLEQKNALKFYQVWKPKYATSELKAIADHQKLSTFVSLFVAKNSLYQIATKTNVDTLFLSRHLQKSIAEELLVLLPFEEINKEQARPQKSNVLISSTPAKADNLPKTEPDASATLIVCIDDSKAVQKQVKMTLEAGGYRVLSILDPTQALKQLSQHQPAMIFLDINMPGVNGYDLCSLLRKSQRFKHIPIVMLTGRDGMIDRVRAKIAGATDYLTKPCDPNKLISLTKVLEKSTVADAQKLVETN